MTPVFRLCDEYLTEAAALDPVWAGARGLSASFAAATDYGPDGIAARAELTTRTLAALAALPVTSDAARLPALPVMFTGWRASLDEGLRRGLPGARRQALATADQADRLANGRTHDA